VALCGQPCDLSSLGCQVVAVCALRLRTVSPVASSSRRALRERFGTHRRKRFVCGPQLGAGVDTPMLSAKPFPVDEVSPREGNGCAASAESIDRFPIEGLGILTIAQEARERASNSNRPVGRAGSCRQRDVLQRVRRARGLADVGSCLDELDERRAAKPEFPRMGARLLGGRKSILITPEPVEEHRIRVVSMAQSHPVASRLGLLENVLAEPAGLVDVAPPASECQGAVCGQIGFGDRTGLLKLFGEQRGRCELASVQEHPDPLADG
jgi:hypothetical protein